MGSRQSSKRLQSGIKARVGSRQVQPVLYQASERLQSGIPRTSEAGARSGCAGRRAGSVSAASVATLPGAKAAAVSISRACKSCPRHADFGTGCGSSCAFVVPTAATGACLFVFSRAVSMQLVEAALAEQLDPANGNCTAVSSRVLGARL